MREKTTVSVIKTDVRSLASRYVVHPAVINVAKSNLETTKTDGLILDYYVTNCGDDLQLILTHRHGSLPGRLNPEEMEHMTLPQLIVKLKDRFRDG